MPQSSAQLPLKSAGPRGRQRRWFSTRDGVDLAAERGHPEAVDDVAVGRRDLEVDDPVDRDAQVVDRDGAVLVHVAPVELPALDPDRDALVPGPGGLRGLVRIGDPGAL